MSDPWRGKGREGQRGGGFITQSAGWTEAVQIHLLEIELLSECVAESSRNHNIIILAQTGFDHNQWL